MNVKLYVGNLKFTATEEEVKKHFEQIGPVREVNVIENKITGRPAGFCFVHMTTEKDALQAIQFLHGREFLGRELTVAKSVSQGPHGARRK